jgi:uncharacterized protein (TIGR00730 family)
MSTIQRVSIFCGASQKADEIYYREASEIARLLVEHGVAINYGGGEVGMMGVIADTVLSLGGQVRGVIPKFMVNQGWVHPGLTDLHVVDSMHTRKMKLVEDVDGVIALPGGCGTLDELLEMITLKQLGQFTKPILILNTRGFFDPLLHMMERMIELRFMNGSHRDIWQVIDSPGQLMEALSKSPGWSSDAIHSAVVT